MELLLALLLALLKLGMVALVAGLGGYFGSYLKKKGENLATHEDIDKVLDQVRAVTQTTKEIEAKISNDVWDRQTRWEMKRDLLFDAAKRMGDADNKLSSLNTFWTARQKGGIDGEESRIRLEHQYVTEWMNSFRSFEEVQMLTLITCSTETMKAFAEVADELRTTAAKLVDGDLEVYSRVKKERDRKFGLARVAIRRELGIAFTVMPLSTGSSAATTPD